MRGTAILLLAAATVLAACGDDARDAGPRPAPRRTVAGGETDDADDHDDPDAFSRTLPAGATWSDLVALARRLDARRADASDTGCLLGRSPAGGHRLAADLAVTVRPLAAPSPGTLEAVAAGAVSLASRWGVVPGPAAEPAPRIVADFTLTTPPPLDARHVVLAASRDRLVLRPVQGSGRVVELATLAAALSGERAARVHLVADPDVPLERIAALLAVLDGSDVEVSLAVVLAAGARPPAEASGARDGPPLCPDGLPDPAGDTPPPSARELLALREALGPLRDAASRCHLESMAAGVGEVEVVLALRVEPDGTVPEACVAEESRPAPALRRCLVGAARGLAFPASQARGALVLELPFALRASPGAGQRPLCGGVPSRGDPS